MTKITLLLALFAAGFTATAQKVLSPNYVSAPQTVPISIHQEQSAFYNQYNFQNEADYDALTPAVHQMKKAGNTTTQACSLEYAVYGWHPYWVGTAYTNYDFSLLSTFSYFSYELVPSTGSYSSIHSWKTTPSIDLAQAAGTRVELCVTNFGSSDNTTFLSNTTAQQTFIDSLISLLNYRNADGVNIDFEGIPGAMRNNLTTFMIDLSNQLKAAIPGATVTMAIFSVDWNNVFDIPALDPYVDQFIIMGYGYYYGGSSVAGPTAEFYKGTIWSNYNLVRSVNYYLNEGITPVKLVLGLPYYGYEWETVSNSVPSSTVSTVGSRTYAYVQNNYIGTHPRNWDPEGFNPYYIYQSGPDWRQAWVDDEMSLGYRYDMVKQKAIGGIGIWALGYDNGYSELWDLLYEKFTNCGTVPCSDTIYDTGGPLGNHYNKEDYSFTIAPSNSNAVSLTFSSFSLETGYDSLWIYDGPSTSSPLIGGYSGTGSPGTVTSTGNALTVEFFSDVATINSGWEAVWNCIVDSIPPTTLVSNPNTWETTDFTVTFTDADLGGSGLNEKYYQALEFNTVEWRANEGRGFFNDNFDGALHSDWTNSTGTWAISGSTLQQSDEGNSNTNLYASLTQNNSQPYLYHWLANMQTGSSSNKRQGLHFFCDDATQSNRGNSYFVYFREEDDECQIFKVVSNTFTMMQSEAVVLLPDVVYDYKVTFDPVSGVINAYVNNSLIASWTDSSPYTSGNSISLRTGNSNTLIDDLKVYKGRSGTATIAVGPSSFDDIRYQNPNPTTPSGRIVSIVNDSAANWSAQDVLDVNIDWTVSSLPVVLDGVSSDIDTICDLTAMSANWSAAADSNSGVSTYYYSIGTSPGDSDVVGWVNNGSALSITHTGLTLQNGTTYYFNVAVENGAGLFTNASSSDGQSPIIPNALISSDVTAITLPDTVVNFIDSSSGADSWSWTFTGGSPGTSTAQNPVVSYTTSGSYDVALTVSNAFGCSSSQLLTSYIVVSDPVGSPPISAFSSDITAGCAPLTVTFSDASANAPDSLMWTFTGGNPASSNDSMPVVTFSQAGSYEVTLQTFNQFGEDSITQVSYITVYPIPTATISGDSSICDGESTVLTGSGGTTYSWNTGQITPSITVTPTVYTNYSLMVTENGCVSLPAFVNVNVTSAPAGTLTDDQTVCIGDQVSLMVSGGDTYNWSTGASSTSISVSATGTSVTYSVEITKSNCPDTVFLSSSVLGVDPPMATFTATDTVLLQSYASATFTNSSTFASSYYWDFGDGNNSNGINPWNTYMDTGYYTVSLTAINGACPNDTLTMSNYVHVIADTGLVGIYFVQEGEFKLYPNPFSSDLYVHFATVGTYDLELVDVLGKVVYQMNPFVLQKGEEVRLNLSEVSLSSGVYLLTVSSPNSSVHLRVVKE